VMAHDSVNSQFCSTLFPTQQDTDQKQDPTVMAHQRQENTDQWLRDMLKAASAEVISLLPI
jgi:hypothetical protein